MIVRGIGIGAIIVALPFVWLWNCAAVPASLHNDLTKKIDKFEEDAKPKIGVGHRYHAGFAEIILTNLSSKSLPGIELSFRNYRRANGSDITNVIYPMLSVDEKGPKIQLDPGVQTFFRFATTKTQVMDNPFIQLTPSGQNEINIEDKEVGVKFTASGKDIPSSTIEFRLSLNDDGSLSIEAWEPRERR